MAFNKSLLKDIYIKPFVDICTPFSPLPYKVGRIFPVFQVNKQSCYETDELST